MDFFVSTTEVTEIPYVGVENIQKAEEWTLSQREAPAISSTKSRKKCTPHDFENKILHFFGKKDNVKSNATPNMERKLKHQCL